MQQYQNRVFLDIKIDGKDIGRLEFELFQDTPITSENFRALCTGEKGNCKTDSKKQLHFQQTIFHRIIPGFMAQGGDITRGNGTGGESIYGKQFNDENFLHEHLDYGDLSMANGGRNTNSSQFFITFAKCPHLDGKHVVFGKLVKGDKVLQKIEQYGSQSGKPLAKVEIAYCGQFGIPALQ